LHNQVREFGGALVLQIQKAVRVRSGRPAALARVLLVAQSDSKPEELATHQL